LIGKEGSLLGVPRIHDQTERIDDPFTLEEFGKDQVRALQKIDFLGFAPSRLARQVGRQCFRSVWGSGRGRVRALFLGWRGRA
jgi:hypothetical protein